jgi:hypothetical protein
MNNAKSKEIRIKYYSFQIFNFKIYLFIES